MYCNYIISFNNKNINRTYNGMTNNLNIESNNIIIL